MSKFFVDSNNIDTVNKVISISGEDVNHLKNVLRVSTGDRITICDGRGYDYESVISEINNSEIKVIFEKSVKCNTEPSCEVTIFQGIAKGDRMDQLIQKCVELGISQIVPVICKRTIVNFKNEKDKEAKKLRWQKIASEAAKQCNRGIIPKVLMPVSFNEAINMSRTADLKIIPYEEEKSVMLKDFLSVVTKPESIAFFIGPEGGFEENEIHLAAGNNIEKLSLGSRILRTETAGPAVLAILGYVFEF